MSFILMDVLENDTGQEGNVSIDEIVIPPKNGDAEIQGNIISILLIMVI